MSPRSAAVLLVLAACGATDAPRDVPPDHGAVLVPGFRWRTDEGEGIEEVRFVLRDGAYDIHVGPGLILYRPDDRAQGEYAVSVRVEQLDRKGRAHGAGVIFGGRDLDGTGQVYTYFLVRGDGAFLVKTRDGAETRYLTQWTIDPAVAMQDEDGRAANDLRVEVGAADTVFLVNGFAVFRIATDEIHADGIYGLRLNHNLDMRMTHPRIEPRG